MKLVEMDREKLAQLAEGFGLEVKGTGKGGYIKAADYVNALRTAGYEDEPEAEGDVEAKIEVSEVKKQVIDLSAASKQLAEAQETIEKLTLALAAAQQRNVLSLAAAEKSVESKLFELKLTLPTHNYNSWYHNHRGEKKNLRLTKDNPSIFLTAEQIAEIRERSPNAFFTGRLSAPEIVPETSNHVHSLDQLISTLTIDNVNHRVEQITSVPVLWMLYAELENRSVRTHDDAGNPLKDLEGKPMAVAVTLPPLLTLLKAAVQSRLTALTPRSNQPEVGLPGGVAFSTGQVD